MLVFLHSWCLAIIIGVCYFVVCTHHSKTVLLCIMQLPNTVHCRAVSLAPWPAHVYHCVATDLGSTYSYYHPVWRSLVLRASVCLSECISVHTWSLVCASICTYLEFIVYEHLYVLGVYCVRASVHTWSLLCTSICTCRVMSYLPT